MINDTLFFMLIVGIIISAGMLFLFIWAAKSGQFDDSNKMVNGLLFHSIDDLNDAIKKERNIKEDFERFLPLVEKIREYFKEVE